MARSFDVVVVGAGHAGCEAAAAAARLGKRVAMVTLEPQHVGRLSCNPAIGGLAKGQLVRELDALGGLMARAADAACIQFRRLNTRKGLAVQASRAQVDIAVYPAHMRRRLSRISGLTIVGAEVSSLQTVGDQVAGVTLADGTCLDAPVVIVTTGTFLSGVLHCGSEQTIGGRIGDGAAHALSQSLAGLGLRLGRLKTGTVPRLDGRTIDWDRLEPQRDTVPEGRFSFARPGPRLRQITCHTTYTNPAVHSVIRDNLHRSAMFGGQITGRGPRYCPAIEDKIVRFADRERHLLFVEPEGLDTHRVYLNGLSTSLPAEVQDQVVHGIVGLENAVVLQHGYAVEYDFSDPTQLGMDLQHAEVQGLFFAGQVNGTSGYEEAAVQGFVAGVSAALGETFHVKRDEGYIGVLVDDLVHRGVGGEPYRMFTSRAEHRLLLREDNADRRLMPTGRELGLVDDDTWRAFEARLEAIEGALAQARATAILPTAATLEALSGAGLGPLKKPTTAEALLRRPDASWVAVAQVAGLGELTEVEAEQVEIEVKYAGYIDRAQRRADHLAELESVLLPFDVNWGEVPALSTEVRDRLWLARPTTLGQLSRLPGVTPAAVNVVAAWVSKQQGVGGV